MFQKAEKSKSKLRMSIHGPSGVGKTYSALSIATGLGQKIAVLDTERGSSSKYADKFSFDVAELASFEVEKYIEAIREAGKAGYDVLIIDSLSHAWFARGGLLELVDKTTQASQSKNAFTSGWAKATPLYNQLVDAILSAPLHIIATMRSKTEYVIETVGGKQQPRKVGMAPVQRDGLEYEFDVVGEMNQENTLVISKTRYEGLSGAVIEKPNHELGEQLAAWLDQGIAPRTKRESLELIQKLHDALVKSGKQSQADEILTSHDYVNIPEEAKAAYSKLRALHESQK